MAVSEILKNGDTERKRKEFLVHKQRWKEADGNSGEWLYQLSSNGVVYKSDGTDWFPESKIRLAQ